MLGAGKQYNNEQTTKGDFGFAQIVFHISRKQNQHHQRFSNTFTDLD